MKRIICIMLAFALLPLSLVGCESGGKAGTLTVTDHAGRTVSLEAPATRIVSGYYIASSACLALGLAEKIVGLEEKSEERPIYGLCAPGLSSRAVSVGSAKNFAVEACLSVNPDLVILPKKAADFAPVLSGAGVAVLVVDPEDNARLDEMIRMIATLTGTKERGESLISRRAAILSSVKTKAAGTEKPSVYFCNPSSFMRTAPKDLYQADLVRAAGGTNAGDILSGTAWGEISAEQLLYADPDLVVVPANSTASGRPSYETSLFSDELFSALNAVKENKVYFMPYGIESFDSPVPAGVLGALWLLRTLHPELVTEQEFLATVSAFYSDFYGIEGNIGELLH